MFLRGCLVSRPREYSREHRSVNFSSFPLDVEAFLANLSTRKFVSRCYFFSRQFARFDVHTPHAEILVDIDLQSRGTVGLFFVVVLPRQHRA